MPNMIGLNEVISDSSETWMVDISGKHTSYVRNYLENDNIPVDGINTIIFNAAKTVGYCPDPIKNEENKKTGIVIGKVQSGKTSNFITSVALAFDNGYDLVVILGGTKKKLVTQNKTRIAEYFSNDKEVIVLDTETNKDLMTAAPIKQHIEQGHKKVIIVSLKSTGKIDMLHNQIFNDSYFKKKPVLIFDDEGDEYSPNGKVRKGQESSTYTAIKGLLEDLYIRAFISVTATPQANLLLNTIDVLSPDFGVLVKPGEGYCGLDVFHDGNDKYCITIPDEEISLLDEISIPSSFYKALSMYFVASAIYKIREKNPKKMSMLIHPSWKVNDLNVAKEKTDKILERWNHLIINRDDIAFTSLKRYIEDAYETYKNDGVEVGEFEDLLEETIKIIQYCKVHLVTGEQQINDNDSYYDNNIYIGGQIVGRGLTIKGLVVTYIIRTAKGVSNVDTVEQRARWFGYKRDILDLCRVFATRKILDNFEDIREHEENMWETIENNHKNGKKFKEMKRFFTLDDSLRMTRSNVARTKSFNFQNWNIETLFELNESKRIYNTKLIERFKEEHKEELIIYQTGKNSRHTILEKYTFDWVVENLINKYISPNGSRCDVEYISSINNFLKKSGIYPYCDVVFMRDFQKSEHKVDLDGKIRNFMVGRRPNGDSGDVTLYDGDRKFHKEDRITVQIHNIFNKNDLTQQCPLFAIYIPESICDKLINIIVPDGGELDGNIRSF